MALISTEGLTRRFGRVVALDELTVAVEPGVVGLIGANGAGKSTLIKILLGLLPASSGRAEVLGMDVASRGPEIRARVGYMPEHDCLLPDITATEFVVHMARMSGLPPTAARERAADTLRHVGLYEERYRAVGQYSTGMRQRVKLAQALVHDPDLVLLDEPTNGLDPAGRDEMLDLIRTIGSDFGISVLVTSHLLGELERVCDNVVVIEAGRLTRHTDTSEITAESGVLVVEFEGDRAPVLGALAAAGIPAREAGRLVEITDSLEQAADLVRDSAAAHDVGLIRMERRRHHMSEIFTDAPAEAANG